MFLTLDYTIQMLVVTPIFHSFSLYYLYLVLLYR